MNHIETLFGMVCVCRLRYKPAVHSHLNQLINVFSVSQAQVSWPGPGLKEREVHCFALLVLPTFTNRNLNIISANLM